MQTPVNALWQRISEKNNLETAFDWLCEQSQDNSHNSDVWDYRRAWQTRKSDLRALLRGGLFEFQTVRVVEVENADGQLERREVRCAEDHLVILAISQILQPALQPRLSRHCTHLKGNGGLKQAVRDTQDYIAAHPDNLVIKSDVKSYYASIDHFILAEQFAYLFPNEIQLQRVLWQFMHRTTEFGGNYRDIERGLPLEASLSPLLGAVYLSPLDALASQHQNSFYKRYIDDWVWVFSSEARLRKAVKQQSAVLQALRVQTHPDKTFIGKVQKGFDFLGFHCCPTGVRGSDVSLSRRDKKLQRLYEQGADKKRIAKYLARWLGWGCVMFHSLAYGGTPSQHCRFEEYGWSYIGANAGDGSTVINLSSFLDNDCVSASCAPGDWGTLSNFYTRDALELTSIKYNGGNHVDMRPGTSMYPFHLVTVSTGNHVCAFKITKARTAELASFPLPALGNNTPSTELSVSSYTGLETLGTVITVTATAESAVSGAQTVDVAVSRLGGTNITTGDYRLSDTTITIPDSQTTGSVTFTVQDDEVFEGTENARLTISNPSAGISLGAITSQDITITDDETVTLQFGQADYSVKEDASTASVAVKISGIPAGGLEVPILATLNTSDGTADAGSDYTALSSANLGFAVTTSNNDYGPWEINIINDSDIESAETFLVNLSSSLAGVTIGTPSSATVTISDDDAPPATAAPGEIKISLNGTEIPLGAPATDFGITEFASFVSKTFVVENLGGTDLQLSSFSLINGSGFSVIPLSGPQVLLPGYTATLIAQLDANDSGDFTATARLVNSDSDEGEYDLAFKGTVTPLPTLPPIGPSPSPGSIAIFRASNVNNASGQPLTWPTSETLMVNEFGNLGTRDDNQSTITLRRTVTSPASAVGVELAVSGQVGISDYTLVPRQVTWAAGDTADQTVTLTLINDTLVEAPETLTITLSNPSGGATLGGTPLHLSVLSDDAEATPAASGPWQLPPQGGNGLEETTDDTGIPATDSEPWQLLPQGGNGLQETTDDTGTPATETSPAWFDGSANDISGDRQQDFRPGGNLHLQGFIAPSSNQRGQAAELFAWVEYVTNGQSFWYQRDENGQWKLWNQDTASLTPTRRPAQLQEVETLDLYQGKLDIPGVFHAHIGFRMNPSENAKQPIHFTQTPTTFFVGNSRGQNVASGFAAQSHFDSHLTVVDRGIRGDGLEAGQEETLAVSFTVRAQRLHHNRPAKLKIWVERQVNGAIQYYFRDGEQWRGGSPFAPNPLELATAGDIQLQETGNQVMIYTGKLPDLPGRYIVHVAYELFDGSFLETSEPLRFTIR